MKTKHVLTTLAAGALLSAPAWAQNDPPAPGAPPSKVGEVKTVEGPQASVIVVRGAQTYALLPGDALFEGDRVLTRSNGRVNIAVYDCEKTLEPTASIVIDGEACNFAPITLAANDPALGVPGNAGAIATTPVFVTLLAAGGIGAASALSSSESSTSEVQ